jgi:hypothetical protein
LVEYEQKYGFIDLSKLQEKVRASETDAENAKLKSQMLESDLFQIRDRIMDLTIKFDKSDRKFDVAGRGK